MVNSFLIPLNTIPEIVAAFGGTLKLASWCGIVKSNVSDWIADDQIPTGWHYRLDREARRRGFLINPELLGDRPDRHEQHMLEQRSA